MKIQSNPPNQTPPPAPRKSPAEALQDSLGPARPQPPQWIQKAAVNTVRSDAAGAAVGAVVVGGAALLAQAGWIGTAVAAVAGGAVGGVLAHAAARKGQAAAQEQLQHTQAGDFASKILNESGLTDGDVRDYAGALVVQKDDRMLVRFKDSGDILVAKGMGEKDSVMYLPEGQARVGSPGADMLTDWNGAIPSSQFKLYDGSGKELSAGGGKSLKILFAPESGKFTLTKSGYDGDYSTEYDLQNRSVKNDWVTIEQGKVTSLFGHHPGGAIPEYRGRGVFSSPYEGGSVTHHLPLQPEIFGPVQAAPPAAVEGTGREAVVQMAKAGLEAVKARPGTYSPELNVVAPQQVDRIYEQTDDKDVKALIKFARKACTDEGDNNVDTDKGQVMKGVLTALQELTPERTRAQLFAKAGVAIGGERPARLFVDEIADLLGTREARTLAQTVLSAPTGVKGGRDRAAQRAAYASALNAFDQPEFSLTQELAKAGFAIGDSTRHTGQPPSCFDLKPPTEHFLKAIAKELPADAPQQPLIELTLNCGTNPFRGDELQGLAGMGALAALSEDFGNPRDFLIQAAQTAIGCDKSYDLYGRSTHADWREYFGPFGKQLAPLLADKPELQALAQQLGTKEFYDKSKFGEIVKGLEPQS